MTSGKVLNEKPISLVELKEKLKAIKKRDTELDFRAQRTEEYLQSLGLLSKKKADELYNKLVALNIPRLKDQHIFKIIEFLPSEPEELKFILSGYNISITNENLKKIVKVVNEFN